MVGDELEGLAAAGAQVVVDFTRIDAARETLAYCADAGHPRRGRDHRVHRRRPRRAGPSIRRAGDGRPNCVVAANFAIGAVLMMRFAELAAPWFDGAEIIELHHDGKMDAPSGTALHTAERMAAARSVVRLGPVPARPHLTTVVDGARGGAGPAGCGSTRCASPAWSPTRR